MYMNYECTMILWRFSSANSE